MRDLPDDPSPEDAGLTKEEDERIWLALHAQAEAGEPWARQNMLHILGIYLAAVLDRHNRPDDDDLQSVATLKAIAAHPYMPAEPSVGRA
jgi:hypothetical protein